MDERENEIKSVCMCVRVCVCAREREVTDSNGDKKLINY